MRIPLIQADDELHAKQVLEEFYRRGFIPVEKKHYLAELRGSVGPYLGVETRDGGIRYILDAASQITTLGLGFNPMALFGTAHHPESWSGETGTPRARGLRKAYDALLARQLEWPEVRTFLCHSGAEANEIALGECYRRRANKAANRVLAFEGSFHGRMMVVLAATWNKAKREPFEWKDFTARYCPYPEDKEGRIARSFPPGWREAWSRAAAKNFILPESGGDALLAEEIRCLAAVRDELLTRKIFAVIVEPMQCEGGDRYATDRFHAALLLTARSFGVPVVYDEVQTGFHLSENFFWHTAFALSDEAGRPLFPDYVTCAKKAQTGVVLSAHPIDLEEAYCAASLARGYIQGMMMRQSGDKIAAYEKSAREKLLGLAAAFPGQVLNPRARGLSFAFDVAAPEMCNKLIAKRFAYGLMFYPAGDRTLRFRLNLAFLPADVEALFACLHALCRDVFAGEDAAWQKRVVETPRRDPENFYKAHETLLAAESGEACGHTGVREAWADRLLRDLCPGEKELSLEFLTREKWPFCRDAVAALQVEAYEPARRTPIEKFDKAIAHEKSVALGLFKAGHLVGISFAAPLSLYPDERLVEADPDYRDPDCLYVLDTTVSPGEQGKSYGVLLRYALHLAALLAGRKKLSGRNRDRLARSMLEINLSAGAFEINYGRDDYPDRLPHRDVIYYANVLASPPDKRFPDPETAGRLLPSLVNKVCLSNFVSRAFLADLETVFGLLPEELRKGYTASGESECVDKIVKSIRFHGNVRRRLLTFEGCHFGHGSFLARALSGRGEAYFPVTRLAYPGAEGWQKILEEAERSLAAGEIQSVWIEPFARNLARRAPKGFLQELKRLCAAHATPLVYDETASQGFRYDEKNHFAAGDASIRPDAGVAYLGGQAGLAFCRAELFVSAPLMMISTWDGDEFSLRRYADKVRRGHVI